MSIIRVGYLENVTARRRFGLDPATRRDVWLALRGDLEKRAAYEWREHMADLFDGISVEVDLPMPDLMNVLRGVAMSAVTSWAFGLAAKEAEKGGAK